MRTKYNIDEDKNFDDLAHHFKNKVYQQLKGKIRLAVIERDLAVYLKAPKTIVDAGGGQGQLSLSLAERGHQVSICDISQKMLALAQQDARSRNLDKVRFIQCSIQSLAEQLETPVELLLCHAVLEWMADPKSALSSLAKCVNDEGIVSLAFFNVNSIIYKNLVRGNFRKAESNDYVGMQGSLTPINPLKIDEVFRWCKAASFEVIHYSGIRVFHDYIIDKDTRKRNPEALIEAELKYSQLEPYRSLGRYIHVVLKKRAK